MSDEKIAYSQVTFGRAVPDTMWLPLGQVREWVGALNLRTDIASFLKLNEKENEERMVLVTKDSIGWASEGIDV